MTNTIHNTSELRDAYEWLRILEAGRDTFGNPTAADYFIKDQKAAIRNYHRLQRIRADRAPVLVRDDGIDGCVIRQPLPRFLQDLEQAAEYFRDEEYIDYQYGPYDCTGQTFTRWYKVYRGPDGRFWAYHSIGRDV